MGRELLPAAPLQPCAEALLGRGHIVTLLDWVNLAPGHYAIEQLCHTGMRHPPQLIAEAPHPVVHTGIGFYPCLASTFPAPSFTPKSRLLSFIAYLSINTVYVVHFRFVEI